MGDEGPKQNATESLTEEEDDAKQKRIIKEMEYTIGDIANMLKAGLDPSGIPIG